MPYQEEFKTEPFTYTPEQWKEIEARTPEQWRAFLEQIDMTTAYCGFNAEKERLFIGGKYREYLRVIHLEEEAKRNRRREIEASRGRNQLDYDSLVDIPPL